MMRVLVIITVVLIATIALTVSLRRDSEQVLGSLNQRTTLTQPDSEEVMFLVPTLPMIEQIFSDDHSWTATLSAERKRVMVATGDIIPARSVNTQVLKRGDFTWPYLNTADIVKDADITFINLEAPLIADCSPTDEGMIFCGDTRHIEGLKYIGVDIASLANNHAGNHDTQGVEDTLKLLHDNGIQTTGTADANITIVDVKGKKFAFLGYNDITVPQPGVSNFDEEKLKSEIAQAKQQADIVVVTFHWGVEYRDQPDDRQKYIGHMAIDSGADLVIGNHPHWIQPVEVYKNKLITYAHGNFVFDQEWSLETKQGVIGRYTFYDDQLVDVEYIPIQIEHYGQPNVLEGAAKQKVLTNMLNESRELRAETDSSPQ